MATQLGFSYYRTIDKSEVDLVIEGDFGVVPVEIKLASMIKQKSLRSLKNFYVYPYSPRVRGEKGVGGMGVGPY